MRPVVNRRHDDQKPRFLTSVTGLMTDVTGEAPHLMTNVNRRTVVHEVTYAGARFFPCAFAPSYGPFTGCLSDLRVFVGYFGGFAGSFVGIWTTFGRFLTENGRISARFSRRSRRGNPACGHPDSNYRSGVTSGGGRRNRRPERHRRLRPVRETDRDGVCRGQEEFRVTTEVQNCLIFSARPASIGQALPMDCGLASRCDAAPAAYLADERRRR